MLVKEAPGLNVLTQGSVTNTLSSLQLETHSHLKFLKTYANFFLLPASRTIHVTNFPIFTNQSWEFVQLLLFMSMQFSMLHEAFWLPDDDFNGFIMNLCICLGLRFWPKQWLYDEGQLEFYIPVEIFGSWNKQFAGLKFNSVRPMFITES